MATTGAMLCASVVAWLSHRWPQQREALIGLLYVFGASVALLGAGQDPHGRERLGQLLAADVLWSDGYQVLVLATCALAVTLSRRWLSRDAVFYPGFALVASLAVPVLGLFVVFAALIAPGLWQRAGVDWAGRFGRFTRQCTGLARVLVIGHAQRSLCGFGVIGFWGAQCRVSA
jgi:zinc/manganese transport system permease protein